FDDIPGQLLMNIYAEDKLTGNFFFDYNLMLGFRYEMYRPYEFNLSGLWGKGDIVKSHQGSFFNPRANLMIYFSEFNQLRLSAGTTSKSPSMNRIYPPEDVFRWRNPIDSVIHYFRYDTRVPELKGYKEVQYEVAFD
ncbi:MAG: TonB-dependent receptor, partial [Ignavibacteriaceae bacterium]|nr:TonB-dependent receptor [Ignavibacteriaceae bacterium]